MNKNQQIAVTIGASVVLLMLIFPPFHVQIRGTTFNMGYAFILNPPTRNYVASSVNVGMLLAQWVGTLLLTALAFFTLKSSGASRKARVTAANFERANITEQEVLVDQSKSFFGGQHHPWRRLLARTVDVSTTGSLLLVTLAFAIGTTMPAIAADLAIALENPFGASFLVYLVWIPAEAVSLSLFGTAPAKWLFGIRVAHSNGEFLSFSQALERSYLVWAQGAGLGIPFVALFTQLFAYRTLTRTGTTFWDTSTSAQVTHQQWGTLRTVVCVAVVLGVLILIGALNLTARI